MAEIKVYQTKPNMYAGISLYPSSLACPSAVATGIAGVPPACDLPQGDAPGRRDACDPSGDGTPVHRFTCSMRALSARTVPGRSG